MRNGTVWPVSGQLSGSECPLAWSLLPSKAGCGGCLMPDTWAGMQQSNAVARLCSAIGWLTGRGAITVRNIFSHDIVSECGHNKNSIIVPHIMQQPLPNNSRWTNAHDQCKLPWLGIQYSLSRILRNYPSQSPAQYPKRLKVKFKKEGIYLHSIDHFCRWSFQ